MNNVLHRRQFLGLVGLFLGGCQPPLLTQQQIASRGDPWKQAQAIIDQLQHPLFPDRDFDITAFGAKVGAEEDASEAIRAAVQACHKAGGGRVSIPAGQYLTGPIHLLSNVNLHLHPGATLKFDRRPERYLPAVLTRWEGMELMGYSPLIYAFEQENIAVTGPGILDGQASTQHWWPWKGEKGWGREGIPNQKLARDRLVQDVANLVPVSQRHYASNAQLRPPFIQFYSCQRVKIEDVTIKNSPFWLVNPVLCRDVTVRGVHFQSLGPNSDGCNPESCDGVLIEQCHFDTGDDCIAIKSGRNNDGRRLAKPCENVVIRHCTMAAGHGGVVIGSEISGGARNIFVEKCQMSSPDLERGIRIKTNSVRGGLIEHVYIRDIDIGQVMDALVINYHYEEGDAGNFPPVVRNIFISNLICQQARRAFQLRGFAHNKIGLIQLDNVHFQQCEQTGVIEYVDSLVLRQVSINGQPYQNNSAPTIGNTLW